MIICESKCLGKSVTFDVFIFSMLPMKFKWTDQIAQTFPLNSMLPRNQPAEFRFQHKPPNIYCLLPNTHDNDCILLQKIRASVDPFAYTVYNLSADDFSANTWQASTEILVFCEPLLDMDEPRFSNCDTVKKVGLNLFVYFI